MGIFAVIGIVMVMIGLFGHNGKVVLLGFMVFGIGVAGDTIAHRPVPINIQTVR